jgi:formate dehydrogenase alpha subunit
MQLKKAVREYGAKLIVVDPREIRMVEFADMWLQIKPGTNITLLNAMMNVILEENLIDSKFIESRTEDFEELKKVLPKYTPEYAETVTGIPADDIRKAARLYAGVDRGLICYTLGITEHVTGVDNVLSIANLAMITGNLGKPGAGVNPLRGQNNVQGVCDVGCLPDQYPGYQKVTDDAVRTKFEAAWGVELSPNLGLMETDMMEKAEHGELKAMYIMGENPMIADPDIHHVERALKGVEFLIVQDIYETETTELADVVLPGASFAEKDGTFSNSERRVQRLRVATEPPGEAKPDWEIPTLIATAMGYPMHYDSAADIMKEMSSLMPVFGGISYERIEEGGLQWPCPTEDHPGTPILHTSTCTRGLGKFHAIEQRPSAELPDEEYPFMLTTGRILLHYHSRTQTGKTPGLDALAPANWVEIHPDDAVSLGIKDGEMVAVESRRGRITMKAMVTDTILKGLLSMPFHYADSPANVLTTRACDPESKTPEFKVCAVKVEKV